MPKLRATTFKSSIRQSRGFGRILAISFAVFDTIKGYHRRYHARGEDAAGFGINGIRCHIRLKHACCIFVECANFSLPPRFVFRAVRRKLCE
jgi:hypothetical protein